MEVQGYFIPEYQGPNPIAEVEGIVWNEANDRLELWFQGILYGYSELDIPEAGLKDWLDFFMNRENFNWWIKEKSGG